MPDRKYIPAHKIELAAIGSNLASPASWNELLIEDGQLTDGHPDLTKELSVRLPRDYDYLYDDFAAFADNLLQRGSHIRLTLSEDNFDDPARREVKLLGRIWNATLSHRAGDCRLEIVAFDRLAKARAIGMNISRTTRVLLYTVSWTDTTAGVWDASDPDYLANIPVGALDGSPAGAGANDFMPEGLVSLRSRRNSVATESEAEIIEYTPDTFEYSSARKQIYFRTNRGAVVTDLISSTEVEVNSTHGFADGDSVEIVTSSGVETRTITGINDNTSRIEFGAAVPSMLEGDLIRFSDRTWELRVYYYDPTDLSNSVKKFLEHVATGIPWSFDGGLAIPSADLDLDEIVGFGGVDPLLIRSVLRDKSEGNIQSILEELREAGLLASNYRLEDHADSGKLRGRYLVQDDGAAITPAFGVFDTEERHTLESEAGRVEVYSLATAPENLALGATVTVNLTGDLAGYSTRGGKGSIVDGRGPTQFEVYKTSGVNVNYPPKKSSDDFIVFDIGRIEEFRRVLFRGGHPTENGEDIPMYKIQRLPRWTISASETPISAANPGIPVAREAINFVADPNNIGGAGGYDLDTEATNIRRARYFGLRLEQDCLYRRSDKLTLSGSVTRESMGIVGEFAVLGDGRYKYGDGPFKDQFPFAQIVRYGTTVVDVPDPSTLRVADASWISNDDWIQVMNAGTPVHVQVQNVVGAVLHLYTPITAIIGDAVGEAGRWKFTLAGTWEDLLYPELYDKIHGSTDWLEILEDERPADIGEAEGLAVERLIELIKIQRDYKLTCAYDMRVQVGQAMRAYSGLKPWTPTKIIYNLNSPSSGLPLVTQTCEGTDFEKEPT